MELLLKQFEGSHTFDKTANKDFTLYHGVADAAKQRNLLGVPGVPSRVPQPAVRPGSVDIAQGDLFQLRLPHPVDLWFDRAAFVAMQVSVKLPLVRPPCCCALSTAVVCWCIQPSNRQKYVSHVSSLLRDEGFLFIELYERAEHREVGGPADCLEGRWMILCVLVFLCRKGLLFIARCRCWASTLPISTKSASRRRCVFSAHAQRRLMLCVSSRLSRTSSGSTRSCCKSVRGARPRHPGCDRHFCARAALFFDLTEISQRFQSLCCTSHLLMATECSNS